MNSRMNSGKGFLVPPENETQIGGSWLPLTPDKPPNLPRSNGVPLESQGNQAGRSNWHEVLSVPDRHTQQLTNYKGNGQNFNLIGFMGQKGSSHNGGFDHNVGSYAHTFGNDAAAWNDNPLAELFGNGTSNRSNNAANMPTILNSYSQVDSSWTEGNFTSLLLESDNPSPCSKHYQRINADSLQQMPKDGFPVPFRPNYNLNSPPRSEADATSSTTNSFPFAPVTPDHTRQFENHHHHSESSSQEKDKPENLLTSIGSEGIENHSNELLQHIVDSSSAAVSTMLKEKNNSEGGDRGIDLNDSPQQKPKRRKHRPKVIVEGKPKRTPQPKNPKNTNSDNPSGKRKYVRKKNLDATATQGTDAPNEVTLPNFESNANKNPSGKRKYVRKKSLEATVTQQTDPASKVTGPNFDSKAKSSRRKLDFELENNKNSESQGEAAINQVEIHQEKHASFNLNLDSQATKLCSEINSVARMESAEINVQNGYTGGNQQARSTCEIKVQNGYTRGNQQAGSTCEINVRNGYTGGNQQARSTCNLTHYMNQMPAESIPFPERCAPAAPPVAIKQNALNVIARSASMRNAILYQTTEKNSYSREHQHFQGESLIQNERAQFDSYKNISQANTTHVNLEETRQKTWQRILQMVEKKEANSNEKRGSKRENCYAIEQTGPSGINQMASPFFCQEKYQVDDHNSNSHNFGTSCSKIYKKTRTENGFYTTMCSTPCVTVKDDRLFQFPTAEHNIQKQLTASELHSTIERMGEKRPSRSTQVHNITSLAVMTNSNLLSSTPPKNSPASTYQQGIETNHANMSIERFNVASTSSNPVSSYTNKMLLQKDALHYRQSSMKERGQREQQYSVTIDEITCRLQGLNIIGRSKKTDGNERNALVPYKGPGTMVPYEGFDPIKKRKPRPKVDLDPETNRIWKLLMGKEGSEGTEAGDKEKWWEEERKVFRGRADSFIARMHLVQGDRRFSMWKGSVVDSVIGVFLTQNVSDHLSSSAFMSLAARFPLWSTTSDQPCYHTETSILVEEPAVQILGPDGAVKCHEKIVRQPVFNQAPVTYHESPKHRTEDPTSGTARTSQATEHHRIANGKAGSSQNSSDSFVIHANGEIQSCSGSNSEASTHGGKSNKIHGPPSLLHTRRTASFQIFHNPVTGSLCFDDMSTNWHKQSEDIDYNKQIPRLQTHPINSDFSHMQGRIVPPSHFQLHMTPDLAGKEADCFGMLREESISSLPSTDSGIAKGKGVDYMNRKIGHTADIMSKNIVQQNGVPMIPAPTINPYALLTNQPTHQKSSLQSVPQTGKGQLSLNAHQQERFGPFQLENTLVKERIRQTDAVAMSQSCTRHQAPNDPKRQVFDVEERTTVVNKQQFLETTAIEVNEKEQIYCTGETTPGMSTNMSNARKGKAGDEKGESFDWDSLRKLVEPNGRRKERNKDKMDSLDYEALRCANVNEISNAIKERGMNNILAERIKDFLNRLVREHGSIDLEWLRDVPPEKAKDYLLSIRGLGLKSVECVRLLTLHHLAFPVDTNVGRIAVRLGWVPLQPLPESLQLHLLELYPMLESIQKYLWPRLCKLDQRTLYELHYQMITFGKVFCTKSKPNCNACPMRGECRHFASAFASARLALPGPEEKSVVSSAIPVATDKSPAVAIKPMPLLPAGSSEPKEMESFVGTCEPIVEEPTTPEPENTEITESDIEDAFYEDPDEIPTIKLNIEEFTMNLHNYMQENMDLHEGDMSKALVALNREAASIPTPKLKNVSRLRTEHQVYELPDSHPLLQGLDKREPDDPSPYLLAIWTPGETANSVQPPERSCASQESGKLCNEKTCFSCSSVREANSQTVRGTILIPCRTAMRGSFPLNGTYFQVNEMFADHESSLNPIDVPRAWIWNLPRRTVYFGTSVTSIFKGLPTEGIQYCFWRGFVCVRGFDQKTRAPRPLMARLHFPASKLIKTRNEGD
ncbi:transcriptional activator DEMETER-like isoform X2 [Camellia sinensis]|uniref:transcriptional activator DEMETER-like isoform X2 n=1 Tax=Camellia sinensis TaxID=4442 RepID=UPI001035E4CA|nr:transcriptional activator DEMETER-like isoform X2 [Camellia sinensis]